MGPIKLKVLLLFIILYFVLLGFLLTFAPPCNALDLSNSTADSKILKSLDEEPDMWVIRDSKLLYISSGARSVKDVLYPEHDDRCIVYITFRVLYPDGRAWVHIERPGGERLVEGELGDKFVKKIREVLLRELTEKYKTKLSSKFELEPKLEHTPKKMTEDKYSLEKL